MNIINQNLKYSACFLLICFSFVSIIAQNGFAFPEKVNKDKIAFELVNNLVIVPVEINGTPLSFLLDTGVHSTLLFSFEELDSLQLNNTEPVKIKGLGSGGSVDAFVSKKNTVSIGKATDFNHTIYLVLDRQINFSTRMGLPIHGIIGFDFFRRFVVKTDYSAKRLTFYARDAYSKKRCKNCVDFALKFHANKPFIETAVRHKGKFKEVTLLVDSGSSDGLWLFDHHDFITETPKNYFVDFLGLGLSGNIFGKRAKIDHLVMADFEMKEVTASFPDSLAIKNISNFGDRDGSLGSEVLRRFTVIMDYANRTMTLKKNRNYEDPFLYNMAGLTIEHDGLIPVKEVQRSNRNTITMQNQSKDATSVVEVYSSPLLQFFLAPKFVVAEVRPGSPADLAGIQKGDEVVRINGKNSYKYKLYELVAMFSSKVGRTIHMEISRNNTIFKRKFELKKVL